MTVADVQRESAFDETYDIDAVLQASDDFVAAMEQRIEQQRAAVARQAEQVTAAFWDAVKETREENGDGDRGYYGLRSRRREGALEIAWFRLRTYNTKAGRKTFPQSITKGKGFRYPTRAFSGAKEWERSLIDETEARCETLRRQWDLLSRLARSVREYKKVLKSQE